MAPSVSLRRTGTFLQCPGAPGGSKFREKAWIPQEPSWHRRSSKGRLQLTWTEPFLRAAPLGRLKSAAPACPGNISCPCPTQPICHLFSAEHRLRPIIAFYFPRWNFCLFINASQGLAGLEISLAPASCLLQDKICPCESHKDIC